MVSKSLERSTQRAARSAVEDDLTRGMELAGEWGEHLGVSGWECTALGCRLQSLQALSARDCSHHKAQA